MVQHFIAEACQRFSTPEKQLTAEAMRACVEAPWKGNARSLKAAIEQAVILSAGTEISAKIFSPARNLKAITRVRPARCGESYVRDLDAAATRR